MDPRITVLSLVTIADFLIALVSYFQSKKSLANRAYALFALAVTVWGASLALFLWIPNVEALNFLARLIYFSGGSIAPAFYYFARLFQSSESEKVEKKNILVPVIIVFILYFFSDSILKSYIITPAGARGYSYGPLWFLFDIYLYGFFALALYELLKKYRFVKDSALRIQITYITLGTYIVLPVATVTNILSPYFGQFGYLWVGPTTTVIWVVLITYAIAKYNLLNIKVIATEVFTVLITFLLLTDIFLSSSTTELLVKFAVLLLTIFLEVLLIRGVLQEVKTREQIEKLAGELTKANTELERVNQAKSDFLSIASHQLKTPLSIVKGYLSMATEGSFGKLGEGLRGAIEKVYLSNERLISLVEDLLNLSRIEDGRMKYDWSEEDLGEVVNSVVEEFRPSTEKKGLQLTWERPKEKFGVRIDKAKIRNVVFNLVDNAVKYTEEGSVDVSLTKNAGKVRVDVSDTGLGIASDKIGKLFVKFERLEDGHRNYSMTGFGLGLYITKLIVKDHQGDVRASSPGLGGGSTFSLELPLNNKGSKIL